MKKIFLSFGILSVIGVQNGWSQLKDFKKPADQYFEISKNLEIISNIFKEINKNYVDNIEPGKMTKTAMDAMLYELDPYTNYFTEADKEDFESHASGKYGGVGITLQIIDSNIYVGSVQENSPSHKANIKAGDRIISVNDISVKGKSDEEMSLILKGAPNTSITIELQHPINKTISKKTINRETIEVKSVLLHDLVGKDKDIAYIFLSQFQYNSAKEVKTALDDLKNKNTNLKGVILDLRGNPGGLLDQAVDICNLFLPKGKPVVSIKGKNENSNQEYITQNEPWDTNIPITILINNGSASASEVVSGTLQDYDRAVIIGTKSFGKGLVQNVIPMGYNTAIKVTTAKYYTPSGRCIQAIDYSHRNPDGSVSSVPDSLKKEFKTTLGRKVFDGGGIDPDIVTKSPDINRTIIGLLSDGQIFNFSTDYYYKHSTITTPDKFFVTDAEFEEFLKFLNNNGYQYNSLSEDIIKSLEKLLEKENYLEDTKKTIQQLKTEIESSKKNNLKKNKDIIKLILSNEIVSRYYFQKGKVLNRLYHDDTELNTAVETLYNQDKYKSVFNIK